MDSPGGEFNSYKSKRLVSWQMQVFQTGKNRAIAEDFRMAFLMNTIM